VKGDNGKAYCSSAYIPGVYARTLKGSALGVRHPLVLHFDQRLACQAKRPRFESRVFRGLQSFADLPPLCALGLKGRDSEGFEAWRSYTAPPSCSTSLTRRLSTCLTTRRLQADAHALDWRRKGCRIYQRVVRCITGESGAVRGSIP